jgi:hypothetical protein
MQRTCDKIGSDRKSKVASRSLPPFAQKQRIMYGIILLLYFGRHGLRRSVGLEPDGWRFDSVSKGCEIRWRPPQEGLSGRLSLYRRFHSPWLRLAAQVALVAPFVIVDLLRLFPELGLISPIDLGLSKRWLLELSLLLAMPALWVWWDAEANRERRVVVPLAGPLTAGAEWDSEAAEAGNLFPNDCLFSLRPSAKGARPGRVRLVFNAPSGREVQLLGSPGLLPNDAAAIVETVKSIVATPMDVDTGRTKRCSGLAIKSGGVDDPLVASR